MFGHGGIETNAQISLDILYKGKTGRRGEGCLVHDRLGITVILYLTLGDQVNQLLATVWMATQP
jgi:hypothetical protein